MSSNRSPAIAFVALLILCLSCYSAGESGVSGQSKSLKPLWVTHEVTFAISIGGEFVGYMVFGIFFNSAPRTVNNFLLITIGNTTSANGFLLTYKKCTFHRTIRNFMIQGGDITKGNGWGVASVYGGNFDDENFDIPHYGAGWIGMANAGPNTNGCQFYITTASTPWLDDKHTLFGKVIGGMDVVRKVEFNPTDQYDRPIKAVVIEDCWVVVVDHPYTVTRAAVDG